MVKGEEEESINWRHGWGGKKEEARRQRGIKGKRREKQEPATPEMVSDVTRM